MTRRTALTPNSRIVVAPGQSACQVGVETVILNLTAGRYYGFANVGTRIWQLVQSPTTVAIVQQAVSSAYDVDAARCEADVIEFVGRLVDAGLVRHLDSDAGAADV